MREIRRGGGLSKSPVFRDSTQKAIGDWSFYSDLWDGNFQRSLRVRFQKPVREEAHLFNRPVKTNRLLLRSFKAHRRWRKHPGKAHQWQKQSGSRGQSEQMMSLVETSRYILGRFTP